MKIVSWLAEGNPQLVRELKGRLKPRTAAIAATISLVGQFLLYFLFKQHLPTAQTYASRYCTGALAYKHTSINDEPTCVLDLHNNVMLLKELWWLDLFTALSLISIVVLVGGGIALLVGDLARDRGTLSYIRLSPRSAGSILIGKILGVPVLTYLAVALALPLHVGAGLAAGVSLGLIVGFYAVLVASCACFYSLAMLVALWGKGDEAIWLSLTVLSSLFLLTLLSRSWSSGYTTDWLMLFNPGTALPYLVQSTFLPHRTVGYFDVERLNSVLWYGQPLWQKPGSAIALMLVNYSVCTYWFWEASKRQFRQRTALWSKQQSYWITSFFSVITLGFVLQTNDSDRLLANFEFLLFFAAGFLLVLIASLSPHRQTLQDWARYRHQLSQRSLTADLLWGEKSPAPVAIALNLAIIVSFVLPAVALFPIANKLAVGLSLLLSVSLVVLCAVVAQLMLMMKSSKRGLWATAAVSTAAVAPLLFFGIVGGLCIQWLAIVVCTVQLTRKLRSFGRSQTKFLNADRSC